MLPAQNLRPESLLFVLATESRALNVVATSATTICFVSRNLIPKAKEIIKQKSHTPYYDKSNAKALLTSAYQKSFPYLPEGRKKPPLCKGRWHAKRDGGIVKDSFVLETIPQPPSAELLTAALGLPFGMLICTRRVVCTQLRYISELGNIPQMRYALLGENNAPCCFLTPRSRFATLYTREPLVCASRLFANRRKLGCSL